MERGAAVEILVTGSAGFIGFHLARCLLPAACCLLPAACCLLPAACCLLAEGYAVTGTDAMIPYYDLRLKEARHA